MTDQSEPLQWPGAEQKAFAARTAESWRTDWAIYLGELQRLTGLTLEQALLFHMMRTWQDMLARSAENMAFVRKHVAVADEHRPNDWEQP